MKVSARQTCVAICTAVTGLAAWLPQTALAAGSSAPPPPTIVGTAVSGSTVTCSVDGPPADQTWAVEWLSNGQIQQSDGPYVPATTFPATFTIPGNLAGQPLICAVSSGIQNAPSDQFDLVYSAPVTVGLGPAPKAIAAPHVDGSFPRVGLKLYTTAGRWPHLDYDYHYRYQWYVGVTPIPNATRYGVLIRKAYLGKKLTCLVTATSRGYAPGKALSNHVKIVK